MEIAIIGWYGTETIGDRAILAGIIDILSKKLSSFTIRIGTLYPFYTERTVEEDYEFYNAISGGKLTSITLFNTKNPFQLKSNIKSSKLLMVGGGPLMDIDEMSMLEYAFIIAKKKRIKSLLFGCGWGPLRKQTIIEKAQHLVELADYTIFRDILSKEQCLKFCSQFSYKIESSIDPAFFTCHYFKENNLKQRDERFIAVNFRDISLEGDHYSRSPISKDLFINILNSIVSETDIPIKLIPMHNFYIGGDDRVFLTRLENEIHLPNVHTVQQPLSLYETMNQFYQAKLCIGMRYHSIVLQTMLNGNNYIVDYTDPHNGKIIGMINQMNLHNFYTNRYMSLHNPKDTLLINVTDTKRYQYNVEDILNALNVYYTIIDKVLFN